MEMQFDEMITALTVYALGVTSESIPEPVIHAHTRNTLDAMGCGLLGFEGDPCVRARRIAATGSSKVGASVIGLPERSTPEYATFANSTIFRYVDMNDTYHSPGGCHPSDMIPAFLALGEARHVSGMDVLRATYIAYEVAIGLGDVVPLRDYGWDYGTWIELAVVAGASSLIGLDPTATANAIAMAITPNMPMSVARAGQLSNWKGCASAYAAMSGVFATRLAAEGMTGPPQAFAGPKGFFEQTTIHPFRPDRLGEPKDGKSAVERTSLKLYPSDYETQTPISIFSQLHFEGIRPADIVSIHIATYHLAWHLVGGGQNDQDEKWDPKSRETADHSLAYVAAVALSDGTINLNSFTSERVADPMLRPLMAKITVTPDEELTAAFDRDGTPGYRVTLTTKNGKDHEIDVTYPHGHQLDPLTDDEVRGKFLANATPRLGLLEATELMDTVLGLPTMADVNTLTDLFRASVQLSTD
jgi:2-methylcitrate dehydratase